MIDTTEIYNCLHEAFPGHLFSLTELFIDTEKLDPFYKVWVGTPAGEWKKLRIKLRSGLFDDAEISKRLCYPDSSVNMKSEVMNVIVHEVREELEENETTHTIT